MRNSNLVDYELETGLIGSLLIDSKEILTAIDENLKPSDFGVPELGAMFGACLKLHEFKKEINVTSLKNACERLKIRCDISTLSSFTNYSIGNFKQRIAILKEKSFKRNLISKFEKITENIDNFSEEELKDKINEISEGFSEIGSLDDFFKSASDIELVDSSRSLSTGFENLDSILDGFKVGTLTILTGEPSAGKSTILNQIIAENLMMGHKSFIYSGELTSSNVLKWFMRTVANPSDLQKFEGISGEYYDVTNHGIFEIKRWIKDKLFIYSEEKSSTVDNIGSTVEYLARNKGVELFVIDNLMTIDAGSFEEFEKQKKIAKRLKDIAKKYKVCVILVAHPKKRQGIAGKNKPEYHMYDVSGASEVVNLADYELLLTRDINNDETKGGIYDITKLRVMKNRITGKQRVGFRLFFDIDRKRFYTNPAERKKNYRYDELEQASFELNETDEDVPF